MSVERTPSGKYKVRWRDESGRPRSRNFTRKADADAHDLKVKVAKQTGGVVDASRQTLREFGEEWWQLYATANLAPRSARIAGCGTAMSCRAWGATGCVTSAPRRSRASPPTCAPTTSASRRSTGR
jgi:hypothetical protein